MRALTAILITCLALSVSLAQDSADSAQNLKDGHGTLAPVFRVKAPAIGESSGLQHWHGLWWTHNDSGAGAVLYADDSLDFDGPLELKLPGAANVDWEELALLDGDLLVCDIGDNSRRRDDLKLYRTRFDAEKKTVSLAATYHIAYPDGKHDAEAAFGHDGALYIISKQRGEGFTGLYRFAGLKEGEVNTGVLVSKLELGDNTMATAADFDGEHLAILSYTRIFVYHKDKLEGAPLFSTRVHANQCESLCLHDGALVFGNEQRDMYRLPGFLKHKPKSLLPQAVKRKLALSPDAAEVNGFGANWRDHATDLELQGMVEGEYLRWAICGGHLMLAGSFKVQSFTSSSERGSRRGTALILMFGRHDEDFLDGTETMFWLGDNGQTGPDCWALSPADFSLKPAKGTDCAGAVADGVFRFEYAIPLTAVFGEGKLPDSFRFNAWGYSLHGEGEVHLAGASIFSLNNPYTWAEVTVATK